MLVSKVTSLLYFFLSTYVGVSKKGAGPISIKAPATNTQPITVTYFGFM